MSAAVMVNACRRIDAGAAAVRVFMVGCSDGAEETNADNVGSRQLALRGILEVIACAQKDLQNAVGGDKFDSLLLCFFVELVATADEALWVALGDSGKGAPSNSDLCELLGLALRFYADARAAWAGLAVAGDDCAEQKGKALVELERGGRVPDHAPVAAAAG